MASKRHHHVIPPLALRRILGSGIFFLLGLAVVFAGMDFWIVPVEAMTQALSNFKGLARYTDALKFFHVSVGFWALILAIALVCEIMKAKNDLVIEMTLYGFLLCFLGFFFSSLKCLDAANQVPTFMDFLWLSGLGSVALALGLVAVIFSAFSASIKEMFPVSVNTFKPVKVD